jgi:hypothetical protein
MNYAENNISKEIGNIITGYLKEYNLPKIAYLTNCFPTRQDRECLFEDFNYICFCASSVIQMSHFLLMRYFVKYGKTPFDVVIDSPRSCLCLRQFGYVYFKVSDIGEAQELALYVSNNKKEISSNYPILFRLAWDKGVSEIKYLSNCNLEKQFGEADILLRIR